MEAVVVFGYEFERHGYTITPSETLLNRLFKALEVYHRIENDNKIVIVLERVYVMVLGPYGEFIRMEENRYTSHMKTFLTQHGVPENAVYCNAMSHDPVSQWISGMHIAMSVSCGNVNPLPLNSSQSVWTKPQTSVKALHYITSGFEMPNVISMNEYFGIPQQIWNRPAHSKNVTSRTKCYYYETITPAAVEILERRLQLMVPIWPRLKLYKRSSVTSILSDKGFWYGNAGEVIFSEDETEESFWSVLEGQTPGL